MDIQLLSHLCNFKEYIFALFSSIRWDFSELVGVLSIFLSSDLYFFNGKISLPPQTRIRFPLIFSRRRKSANTSYSGICKSSGQVRKFLHCSAEAQEKTNFVLLSASFFLLLKEKKILLDLYPVEKKPQQD